MFYIYILTGLLAIAALECIWLMLAGVVQGKAIARRERISVRVEELLREVINAQSDEDMHIKVRTLKKVTGRRRYCYDTLTNKLFNGISIAPGNEETAQKAIFLIVSTLDPVGFYSEQLKRQNPYLKAHACMRIGEYGMSDETDYIKQLLPSRNNELKYNALMALFRLGAEDVVCDFILKQKVNRNLSYRLLVELLGKYGKDIKPLAIKLIESGDEYLRSVVVKAVSGYGFPEFSQYFLDGMKSRNMSHRAASATALGNIGKAEYEYNLVLASNDRDWVVRNAAVKALGRYNTETALANVSRAVGDSEWWVRYNAARTLLAMPQGMEYANLVLRGNDVYAADMIRHVMRIKD